MLDLLTSMTLDSVAASSLHPRPDHRRQRGPRGRRCAGQSRARRISNRAVSVGIDADRIRGILTAIAPIVGAARVASATVKIAERSRSSAAVLVSLGLETWYAIARIGEIDESVGGEHFSRSRVRIDEIEFEMVWLHHPASIGRDGWQRSYALLLDNLRSQPLAS